MIGMCWSPLSMENMERPIQMLTGLTIKECQLKCQKNRQCYFFKSLYPNRECSLWKKVKSGCDDYLGVSNSILKTCGKGDQMFHFCKCIKILFFLFTPTNGLHDYKLIKIGKINIKNQFLYHTVFLYLGQFRSYDNKILLK